MIYKFAAKRGSQVVKVSSAVSLDIIFTIFNPTDGTGSYFIAGGIGGLIQVSNGGATSTGTPPLFTSTSLDPSIQISVNNQEQTSQNANAQTQKGLVNTAAIQLKESEAIYDFLYGLIAGVIQLFLAKGGGLKTIFGVIMTGAGGALAYKGIYKEQDAHKESQP